MTSKRRYCRQLCSVAELNPTNYFLKKLGIEPRCSRGQLPLCYGDPLIYWVLYFRWPIK